MNGINSTTIASSVRSLNDIQRKAYQEALTKADGGTSGDGILTKEELNKGNEAFFKTDDFKSLS